MPGHNVNNPDIGSMKAIFLTAVAAVVPVFLYYLRDEIQYRVAQYRRNKAKRERDS